MPNTSSAKKRLRQNEVRRNQNRSIKSALRTQLRKVDAAVAAGNIEEAETEYREVARQLDKAGAQSIIHKNQAARRKSRLQKRIKAAKQG